MDIPRMLLIIKFLINYSISQNKLSKFIFDFAANREVDNLITEITNTNAEYLNITETLKIQIYTGSSIDSAEINSFPIYDPEKIFQYIDTTKPSVMYIPGFAESPLNLSIKTVIGAYLERGTDNILLVDWIAIASQPYWQIVPKVKDIARIVTKTLDKLIELGLNLDTLHLVSFSLGVQIAGYIGKSSKYTLPRITGLDPARPGYEQSIAEYIDDKSANFVDILHCDGNFYSLLKFTGTANFYANGGTRTQPGCPLITMPGDNCNHLKSFKFWAESIKYPYAFPATLCPSYLQFLNGDCENNDVVYFGPLTSKNASGSYFFRTNKSTLISNGSS